MQKVPSAVWIVDTKKEHIAVGEARKLGIPVVAILDTNCDPDEVDYKIPGNDDAIRSAALLTRVIADAVAEGLMARSAAQANAGREEGGEPAIGGDEPLADWERELLTGQAAEAPAGRGCRPPRPPAEAAAAGGRCSAPRPRSPRPPAEAAAPAEVAPVAGVPATGDDSTGTQGAQNACEADRPAGRPRPGHARPSTTEEETWLTSPPPTSSVSATPPAPA